jgi:hypothetical protein
VSLTVKGNNYVTVAIFSTEEYADIHFVYGYCGVTQEQQSRNINGGFLIVESQIGESSVMCTGVSEKLVLSLKQSAKDHYDAMPMWKMTYWKWCSAVQVLASEEFRGELGPVG